MLVLNGAEIRIVVMATRRSFLKTITATFVTIGLSIDPSRTQAKGLEAKKMDEFRLWVLQTLKSIRPGAPIALSDFSQTLEVLGYDSMDTTELIMEAEDEFGIEFPVLFDIARIETLEDFVVTLMYRANGDEVPIGLLESEANPDTRELIFENTKTALLTLAAPAYEQLERMGDALCPGCLLLEYYGEWIRRLVDNPTMSAVALKLQLKAVVHSLDLIPDEEKACVAGGGH